MYYGISTGDSGDHGVGDLVTGANIQRRDSDGALLLDGEQVFYVFTIENGRPVMKEEE